MTHDPREALDSLLAFRHGDTKHLTAEHARILYEALTASPGEQEPVAAACADWGQIVQCLLRTMDHPHKGESSTEQAERMATELCRKYPPPPAAATPDHGGADAGVGLRAALSTVENLIRRDPACFNLSDELQPVRTALRESLSHQPAPVAANASAEAITEAGIRAHVGDGMVSMQNVIDAANAILADRASVEARLREALARGLIGDRSEPDGYWIDIKFQTQEDMREARRAIKAWRVDAIKKSLAAGGDEAKKSEGGVEGHASVTSTAALNETSDLSASRAESAPRDVSVPAGIKPGPSDPTAERREIVARELMEKWPGDYAWGDETREPNELAFETADAILAALDGGR